MDVVDGARMSRRTTPMVTTGMYFDKNDLFYFDSLDSGGSDTAHESDDDSDDNSLEVLPSPQKISLSPPLDTTPMPRPQQ
jgi:hypothetical protein